MRGCRLTSVSWRRRERRDESSLQRVSIAQPRPVGAGEDLARAFTLPASDYVDPAVFEREKSRIFGRTWQLVARADELARVGDLKPATILDEPVLITHGLDGKLRGFYNVCRHRAAQVVLAKGNRRSLQCPYHGWTYGLDGRLQVAREMDGTEDFDKADFGLQPIRVERWGPFIFANLDRDAPSLAEVMGAIPDEVSRAGYDVDRMQLVERRDYVINCNWKVYVDNYLEGYHIPIVHPGLFRELDYPSYRTETRTNYSIQHAPLKRPERIRVNDPADDIDYFWIWPNLMLNVYPDNFSTNLIVPLGPTRTMTLFEWYFRDPDGPGVRQRIDETIAFSDEIQLEDIGICEAVQRGLRSSTYDTGRYSPSRENGVHHFHGMYAEAMGLR